VRIGEGSTVVIAGSETVFGSADSTIEAGAEVYLEYVGNSREEQFGRVPVIHVELIQLPYPALYALTIAKLDVSASERKLIFDKNRFKGYAFSVGSSGDYDLSFESIETGALGAFITTETLFSVLSVWETTSSILPIILYWRRRLLNSSPLPTFQCQSFRNLLSLSMFLDT
jgi:hypothetical protein